MINMSSKIDAEIGIGESCFQGRPIGKKCSEEVNLPAGAKRFGRKEEREKGRRKEERKEGKKKGKIEDLKI